MSQTTVLPGVIDTPSDVTWDDLVLPDRSEQSLRQLALWVEHRDQVQHKWQGKVTGGPIALFAGPSGTGKTIAARALANALGLDLYTANLGLLVNRYIGETEKHLDVVFNAAARQPMVLFFDEADSLFGKRSEVNDAHDRYANAGTNYLLSKLERYDGPSLLASPSKERINSGALSRFQFVVDFPAPGAAERSKLWRLYLPNKAPIDNDVNTDKLATEFELTGRQIRNAALQAAFLAAGDSSSISNKHLSNAIQAERAKSGGS